MTAFRLFKVAAIVCANLRSAPAFARRATPAAAMPGARIIAGRRIATE
ncbi:hypothetical protein ACVWZ4_005226 [Bradyrhizobium sp. USDA 4472]